MTRLKDHQAAMVELLAHGSALSASGARMAHALHDVLALLNDRPEAPVAHTERRSDSTTSGLNDALLASDVAAVRPANSVNTYIRELEQLIKRRDNTIRQLKHRVASLKSDNANFESQLDAVLALQKFSEPEQAGCRKEDTQLPDGPEKAEMIVGGSWVTAREGDPTGEKRAFMESCGNHKTDDGWIEWRGGECPIDSIELNVDIKYRNGNIFTDVDPSSYEWSHGYADIRETWADIVAYRIVEEVK